MKILVQDGIIESISEQDILAMIQVAAYQDKDKVYIDNFIDLETNQSKGTSYKKKKLENNQSKGTS